MAKLRTSVASYCVAESGVRQDKASSQGVFEQAPVIPDRRGRGNLYVLVETVGAFPDSALVQEEIVAGVAQEYFRTSGSITAGIRAAIKTANIHLFEKNLKAQPEERGIAGVTLMVLKDRAAYLGQLGPALAYHAGRGECRRLPADSSWLSSESLEDIDPSQLPPLGLRREVEPELSHLHLQQGDVLLLASTILSRILPDEDIRAAAMGSDALTVRENLEALTKDTDISVLVVEVLGVGDAPGLTASGTASGTPSRASGAATEDEMAGLPAEGEEPGPEVAGQRPGLWTRISDGLQNALQPQEQAPDVEKEDEQQAEALPKPERRPVNWGPALRTVRQGLGRLGHALSALLARVLPEESGDGAQLAGAHRTPAPRASMLPGNRRWLYLVLLIPMLLLAIYGVSRWQFDRSRQAQVRQLQRTAEDAKTAAQLSTSPAEQRRKLGEAITALDQALALRPDDQTLIDERKGLDDWLDRINAVARLTVFNTLKEFPDTEGAKSQLSTVIVQGNDVYTLDVGLDRVYKHLFDEARQALRVTEVEPVLVRKGDQHGGIAVDELLDIVWVDSGAQQGIGNVLILDRKGQVLEYDSAVGLRRFATADTSAWRNPVAVAGYLMRRFYVLDAGANRILRYQLNASGYEGAPSDYLSSGANAVIAGGVDIAIDGDVYVLLADGKIAKFHERMPAAFSQKGLDEPLKSPCCLFVTGWMDEGGSVYVADAGNSRIVKFSKAGDFVRQYRSRDAGYMDALRGLFVDEAAKRLYIINGNKLYQASLPD